MSRSGMDDLGTFVVVAHLGSFTTAAAQLGVSRSALSATIRTPEVRMAFSY